MELRPVACCKLAGQCEPGNLIRLERGDRDSFAFVARGAHGKNFVVYLSDLAETPPPRIAPMARPHDHVLCYGTDYRIEVDHTAAFTDVAGRRLSAADGALILEDGRYFLRALAFPRSEMHGTFYVEIATGSLVSDLSGGVIFTSWSVMVPMGGDRFQTLVSYPLTPRS